MKLDDKVIVACASGNLAHAAIAIIRLSGSSFLARISGFFSNSKFTPFKMHRSHFTVDGVEWDDLCYCFFPNPKSYTGEDLLELYVHGNILNVRRFVSFLSSLEGFREALPGEFTRRALQNNKLTLSQAEGLDLFLNANTPLALTQGLSLMHGELHHHYLELYSHYKNHKASLELLLDFSEDVGESEAMDNLISSWNLFFEKITYLHSRTLVDSSALLRPEVVIAGQPNAGKSTLFNRILGENRAIVTPIAGTTRDYLSEDFSYEGVIYRLIDTAGIRESSDQIEAQGIGRGKEKLARSFFKILLINPLESNVVELKELLKMSFDLTILTHSDAPEFKNALQKLESELGVVLSGHKQISLAKAHDISDLLGAVNRKHLALNQTEPLLQERQKLVISNTYLAARSYGGILAKESDIGILSHELNTLAHCLEELLGLVSPDEVLDHIFANFCIGK
jgi:tRNA modification GTPase